MPRAYFQTITMTGGSGSPTFLITAGSLPPGLTLSTSGALTGVPTTAGAYSFTVQATDSSARVSQREYDVDVFTCLPGPDSWWQGEGNTNDSVAANHGTVIGTVNYAAGHSGQGFSFAGAGSVSVPSTNIGAAYSIDMWIHPTSTGPYRHILSNTHLATDRYGSLFVYDSHIEYWWNNAVRITSVNVRVAKPSQGERRQQAQGQDPGLSAVPGDKPKAGVKDKGVNLPEVTLSLTGPLTAQLERFGLDSFHTAARRQPSPSCYG